MKKGQILPLIAIVVSVGAMLIALYRSTHLEWDGVMFGMAMLSALVVLLVGWNIYTLIDTEKIERKFNERIDKESRKLDELSESMYAGVMHMRITLISSMAIAAKMGADGGDYIFAMLSLQAAVSYYDVGKVDNVDVILDSINDRLPSPTIIDKGSREVLLDLLHQLQKRRSSEKQDRLLVKVLAWETYD